LLYGVVIPQIQTFVKCKRVIFSVLFQEAWH